MSDHHSQPVQTHDIRDKDGSLIITSGQKYTIRNSSYSSALVDHTDSNPLGTICVYNIKKETYDSQHWGVSVVDTITGNQAVTFESVAVPGYYAGVQQLADRALIRSNPKPYTWILNPIGPGQYQIKSADGNFFWVAYRPDTFYPILIKPIRELEDYGQRGQWFIERLKST